MRQFSTDGCSVISCLYKFITLGRHTLPFRDACIAHDVEYWMGGSKHEKWVADIKLMKDVADTGYPMFGALMYIAVRMGGVPWLPMPWRWGFGHKFSDGYRIRRNAERVMIAEELAKI